MIMKRLERIKTNALNVFESQHFFIRFFSFLFSSRFDRMNREQNACFSYECMFEQALAVMFLFCLFFNHSFIELYSCWFFFFVFYFIYTYTRTYRENSFIQFYVMVLGLTHRLAVIDFVVFITVLFFSLWFYSFYVFFFSFVFLFSSPFSLSSVLSDDFIKFICI